MCRNLRAFLETFGKISVLQFSWARNAWGLLHIVLNYISILAITRITDVFIPKIANMRQTLICVATFAQIFELEGGFTTDPRFHP